MRCVENKSETKGSGTIRYQPAINTSLKFIDGRVYDYSLYRFNWHTHVSGGE